MTTKDKIARRKLSLLDLASELSNVSCACKVMGYSRQQFYEIRRNFQTYGAEGLIDRLPGAKGSHPNRVPAEIEAAVLAHALDHPCHGALRVEQELRLKGLAVSAGGVRGVWQRHGLLTRHERLLRLEKATAERAFELSEEQTRLLERFHRTVLDEHFRVEGRRTWFETIEEMQAVLDDWLALYNTRRPHQGRNMGGRTPLKAFADGLRKAPETPPEKNEGRDADNQTQTGFNATRNPSRLKPLQNAALSGEYRFCTILVRVTGGE